jgi:hypothetical protein
MSILLIALACGGLDATETSPTPEADADTDADSDTDSDADADADSDTDSDADSDTDSDTDTDPTSDADTFQSMLDGELGVSEGMLAIANNGGWPIDTGSGYIFAAEDSGQISLALAGDHNAWELDAMNNEAGLWWIQASVSAPEDSIYKLVEGGTDYREDPWSRAYQYGDYGRESLVRGGGDHLERWFDVGDANIPGRTLRVWVPAGAVTHQLYLQDGQNLYDPEAFYGGWQLQSALGGSTMAIGIDNGGLARLDEYGHVQDEIYGDLYGGDADDYADYLAGTVRPLIEGEYGPADKVGILGSSMGGLAALYVAWRQPTDWDFAGSMSGTLGWGSIGLTNETVIDLYGAGSANGVAIYVDSGGSPGSGCVDSDGDGVNDDGDHSDNYCENRQFADTLSEVGWTWESDLWHWNEVGASHNEAAWADRVWRPVGTFEGL